MKHAFVNCKFKEIYIPKSVKKIEELAFGYDNMDSLSPEKLRILKFTVIKEQWLKHMQK